MRLTSTDEFLNAPDDKADSGWESVDHNYFIGSHVDSANAGTYVTERQLSLIVGDKVFCGTNSTLQSSHHSLIYINGDLVGEDDRTSGVHSFSALQLTITKGMLPLGGRFTSPSYLEELHKLDNYTKAQYIPDRHQLLF